VVFPFRSDQELNQVRGDFLRALGAILQIVEGVGVGSILIARRSGRGCHNPGDLRWTGRRILLLNVGDPVWFYTDVGFGKLVVVERGSEFKANSEIPQRLFRFLETVFYWSDWRIM
jgi:hypothetical protein